VSIVYNSAMEIAKVEYIFAIEPGDDVLVNTLNGMLVCAGAKDLQVLYILLIMK
jgi:hypothetical protein